MRHKAVMLSEAKHLNVNAGLTTAIRVSLK
jgi:hypothetical protein